METNQLEIDKKYLRMAFVESESSVAIRLKVGCIIVKNDTIISNGHNHQPSFLSSVCEVVRGSNRNPYRSDKREIEYLKSLPTEELETKETVIHAEKSALMKIEDFQNAEGSTLYVTHQPCLGCARLISKYKIKEVIYSIPYRCPDGLDFLRRSNIKVRNIKVCEF